MAFSSSSSSSLSFSRWQLRNIVLGFLAILFLFSSLSTAVHRGQRIQADDRVVSVDSGHAQVQLHRKILYSGFRYHGQAFGFLPKGTQVSQPGPSKRHNAFTDSTPGN
ncbi:hypothetical protein SAY87_018094 [Trapa incisa]|uniref:Uncharacterized protein n=2 Tax=Trapa TaxID=22665 RepID=A0AAN7QZI7_TRANT|nr:hypothetical protein SAY87_018094 [Trapa incisa]KAK4784787.1 hypothetical protein SAY86_019155 [Trapa natans]